MDSTTIILAILWLAIGIYGSWWSVCRQHAAENEHYPTLNNPPDYLNFFLFWAGPLAFLPVLIVYGTGKTQRPIKGVTYDKEKRKRKWKSKK